MAKIKACRKCGVPLLISDGQMWHPNGVISEAKDPEHRMIFFESENLDRVFMKIEETIGMSIERIVVESQRRSTREYLERLISRTVRRLLYFTRPGLTARKMAGVALICGYGRVGLEELHASPHAALAARRGLPLHDHPLHDHP